MLYLIITLPFFLFAFYDAVFVLFHGFQSCLDLFSDLQRFFLVFKDNIH